MNEILEVIKISIVLDPYVGSGTTSVAAKLLGCSYIGIDISKKYIQDAKKRLKNYENERQTIEIELSRHFVKKTFKDRKEFGHNTGKYRNEFELIQKELLRI